MDSALQQEQQTERKGLNAISIAIITAVVMFVVLVGVQLMRQAPPDLTLENPAPPIAVTTFDGESLDLESLRGNVVVVNFWASWCIPCHDEAELLQSTWEQYQDKNFIMLGITHSDVERDSREFMTQYGITYPNAPDPGAKIYDSYGLLGVPETFVIAPDGTLAYFLRGPLTDNTTPNFLAAIDELLEGA